MDEIGFTIYHGNEALHPSISLLVLKSRKPSVLSGFGYAVDSFTLLIQSIIAGQAGLEFNSSYPNGLTIAVCVGMLVGALFWGIGADVVERKIDFNVSLIICSLFASVAGASPNWEVLRLFVCLNAFGAGIASGCLRSWQLGGVRSMNKHTVERWNIQR
ncbi:Sugar (and other) transporter [Ascochyta rabiei]|uniref:Sugar (and other) transporter n=1 Tax=Didymella rabiei TaxID=5454 RepID=UPI0021FDC76E|nr:Sugar (and other) transporter [Ascochyta rabiei]UPX14017.1 Sugar (and other) transporter [Ascochyta rabiei]